MNMRARLEALIEEMLDGKILLAEALSEFEKHYIKKALIRNNEHLSNTAKALGVHRNTISKRVATYQKESRPLTRAAKGGRPLVLRQVFVFQSLSRHPSSQS